MLRFAVLAAALALLLVPGAAGAAPGDPWVAYVANSVVTKQGAPAPVILRADPATGALTEISRNGPQGTLFEHPYDLAVAADGSLLVADMGAFASPGARVPDGRIVRVDPVTGAQALVSSGGLLVDPAGLTLGPDGLIYVIENVGAAGQPGVVAIDPATGAQRLVSSGGELCYPFGIAAHPDGSLIVTSYGSFSGGGTVVTCPFEHGALVRVDRASGAQSVVSRNATPWGNLFLNPLGVAVEPGGRILVVNQNGATALVSVDPGTGLQDAETPNTGADRLVLPQRLALTPAGDVLVSDFTLDDLEGGLVSVDLPSGRQDLLRQDRRYFNNPLGVAVVANRPPLAALAAAPGVAAAGHEVRFDASASRDPEGLALRYAWDLDGNGSFETETGLSPYVGRSYAGTTSLAARVRVSDPHGGAAVAEAPVKVDSLRPVISGLRVRGAVVRFRLSEPARVAIRVQRRVRTRWRTVKVLRHDGRAGVNRLRVRGRVRAAARRRARLRYRARATAVDAVGNRSRAARVRISPAAAQRLSRRVPRSRRP